MASSPWPWIIGGGVALVLLGAAASGSAGVVRHIVRNVRRVPEAIPPLPSGGGALLASSPFEMRMHPTLHQWKMHDGIDLPAPEGTPIVAPVAGTVSIVRPWSGTAADASGNRVAVDDNNGYRWWFLHLSSIAVVKGTNVSPGQILGMVGNTGRSTGPHLHLQIQDMRLAGHPTVDPVKVLPEGTFRNREGAVLAGMEDAVGPVSGPASGDAGGRFQGAYEDLFLPEVLELAETYQISPEEAQAIFDAAEAVGGEGPHLARVMWAESRMKPTAVNPSSGATGLIQLMPRSAAALGTSTAELRRMSFLDQMDFVLAYLYAVADGSWSGGEPGPLDTQFKMAAAVFYPAWRNRDPRSILPGKVREANPGINTMGEYLGFVLDRKPPRKNPEAVTVWRYPHAPGAPTVPAEAPASGSLDGVIQELKTRYWKIDPNVVAIEPWMNGRAVRVLSVGKFRPEGLPGSLDGIPILVSPPPPGWKSPDSVQVTRSPQASSAGLRGHGRPFFS